MLAGIAAEPGQMSDLLERMRSNPRGDWSIRDIERLCHEYDVTCAPPKGGGSHYKISDRRIPSILTVPFRRPIKPVYIRKLVAFIDAVRELP